MKHLMKFNELHSATYINAANKLSDIDWDEYENTVNNLEKHSEMMRIINNEDDIISDEVISIFRDIMRFNSMWDKVYKESKLAYKDYIRKNLRKVDRYNRKEVRAEANRLSMSIKEPYFELRRKIKADTMNVYDIKIGDVFNMDSTNTLFILTQITDIQYSFKDPIEDLYESINVPELPIWLETGRISKVTMKTIYNEESRKWEFLNEEEISLVNETLEEIKEWFEDYGRVFSLDNQDDTSISFSTREHGNVGNETPGEEDIKNAIDIRKELLGLYKDSIEVTIEEVDEWVYVHIHIISTD